MSYLSETELDVFKLFGLTDYSLPSNLSLFADSNEVVWSGDNTLVLTWLSDVATRYRPQIKNSDKKEEYLIMRSINALTETSLDPAPLSEEDSVY